VRRFGEKTVKSESRKDRKPGSPETEVWEVEKGSVRSLEELKRIGDVVGYIYNV